MVANAIVETFLKLQKLMNDVTMQKHFLAASTLVMNCLFEQCIFLGMLLSKPVIFLYFTILSIRIKKKVLRLYNHWYVLRYEQGMSNDVGPKVTYLCTYSICQYDIIKKEVNKSLGELLYNLWCVDMNKEFPLKRHFIQKKLYFTRKKVHTIQSKSNGYCYNKFSKHCKDLFSL